MEFIDRCFDESGALTAAAGEIASPFEKLMSRISEEIRRDPRQIVNNALIYAAACGQHLALQELLNRVPKSMPFRPDLTSLGPRCTTPRSVVVATRLIGC